MLPGEPGSAVRGLFRETVDRTIRVQHEDIWAHQGPLPGRQRRLVRITWRGALLLLPWLTTPSSQSLPLAIKDGLCKVRDVAPSGAILAQPGAGSGLDILAIVWLVQSGFVRKCSIGWHPGAARAWRVRFRP